MSVAATQNATAIQQLLQLYGAQATGSTTLASVLAQSDTSATATTGTDSATFSKPSEIYAKLQQLMQQDPTKAKALLSQIADQLKTAAQQQTGDAATRLNDLASKFENAAQTGDLSQLKPPAHHGHHRPASTAASAGDQVAQYAQNESAFQAGGAANGTSGKNSMADLMSNILAQINSALSQE